MDQEIINLTDIDSENEKRLNFNNENLILTAAKRGDAEELTKLLESTVTGEPICEPKDIKFTFEDLLKFDSDGRTCLHLATTIGNHDTALMCVEILLTSFQLIFPIEDYESKLKKLIDFKDFNGETALHLAIQNKATRVVTHLIEKNAGVSLKSKEGIDALSLIYQKVPEAMQDIYDNSIELTDDFKGLRLDFGPIIGYVNTLKEDPPPRTENGNNDDGIQAIRSDEFRHSLHLESWKKETENLSLILKGDAYLLGGGSSLLTHSLVKIFLHLKWKQIQLFFYLSFFYHIIWLLVYAAAFVNLHSFVESTSENKTTASQKESHDPEESSIIMSLWYILLVLTLLVASKEIYQAFSISWTYLMSFENLAQFIFILFCGTQFGLLMTGHAEIVASMSVVGILLCTILMICQLGKTPYFGLQVAALTRVVYSCKPHMILFIVWFFGFGLAFWALFYKTEDMSILRMPAIVTGMATGELNLMELMEKIETKTTIVQVFSVFCLLAFIVIIVTLYFNLLIGYAVSDIQLLKTKAEVMELANKLRTIFTLESFLVSTFGQLIVRTVAKIRCKKCSDCRHTEEFNVHQSTGSCDFLRVVPSRVFEERQKKEIEVRFEDIPEKILKQLKEIAYNNLLKEKEC